MDEILLIDDDTELCEMLTEYLARYDLHVSAVHRGDAGLQPQCSAKALPSPGVDHGAGQLGECN